MYVEKILPYRTLEFNCIQHEGKHSNNKLIVISPSLLSILLVVFFGSFDDFSGFVSGERHWDFWFCGFGYFLDRFWCQKTSVFRFFSLQFTDFPFLTFSFSVFAKIANGFSDAVFGFPI